MIGPAARDQDSSSRPRSLNKGPEGRGNSMKRPRCFPACIALIPKSWHSAVARFAHRYCGAPPGVPVARFTDNEGGRDLPGRISQPSLRLRRAREKTKADIFRLDRYLLAQKVTTDRAYIQTWDLKNHGFHDSTFRRVTTAR